MEWTRYGSHAVLVRFADKIGDDAFARGCAIAAELERNPPPGLREFVPAYTTVLLEFSPRDVRKLDDVVHDLMDQLEAAASIAQAPAPPKEIPIVYDGEDLDRVASLNKLTVEEVCRLHAAPIYKVYMLGFTPGFPYLGDLDRRLHTPRLPTPRLRVAAGAVAIGGGQTGIYSIESPGGWNVIGHTTLKLFDPVAAAKPETAGNAFLLKQGDRVKFVPRK